MDLDISNVCDICALRAKVNEEAILSLCSLNLSGDISASVEIEEQPVRVLAAINES